MADPEWIYCTICGMSLDDQCVVYLGPHWPHDECPSLNIADQELTRYEAEATNFYGAVHLSNGHRICPPEVCRFSHDGVTSAKMYIAVHPACEDMASRVMKTSSNAKIKSTGDLWLALERRCASYLHWQRQRRRQRPRVLLGRDEGFIPYTSYSETDKPSYLGFYVPVRCLLRGDDWEGWWDEDPVDIPNLTNELMSNLERADPTPDSQVKGLLELSPNEIKNRINTFLQGGDFSLDCNYLMPQSMWAEVFFQTPFLWDLDIKAVYNKTGSSEFDLQKWNWEKLTRQIMSRVEPSPDAGSADDDKDAWDYSKVELNVPGGFTNRRRIWQMLEELHPNVSLLNYSS